MSNITIILQKSFHHNNLTLQLEYLTDFEIYHINIIQNNTKTNHSLFGIFTNPKQAIQKFNSIQL
jgi:hypothetical protein